MRLVLHIVRKDLWRLRGWLALWALMLAGEVGAGWLVRSGGWTALWGDWQKLTTAVQLLAGLNRVIVFPLTLLLVQEDAPAGTRQFWITRPISGAKLFAAKCLGVVLLFGGVPVLVALPWWLSCGLGPREMAWAVVETVGLNVLIALPAMLLAALADSLQRAFLWTLVMLAAWAAGTAMWGYFVMQRTGTRNIEVAWSRTWIALAALALGAVVAVVVQFLTRRLVRSLAIFGGGLVLAVVIAGWWPAQWSSEFKMTEANAGRATAVKLEFDNATYPDVKTDTGGRDDYLRVQMIARGVPADRWLAGIETTTNTWRWPDGLVLVRDGWAAGFNYWRGEWNAVRARLGLREPQTDPETARVLQQSWEQMRESSLAQYKRMGLAPLPSNFPQPPPRTDVVGLQSSVMVPRSLVARMRVDPPAYETRIWLQVRRPEVWFETPLQVGGWQSHATHRMRVARTERVTEGNRNWRFADQLKVTLAETWPTTWWDDWALVYFPRANYRGFDITPEQTNVYAVNRSLGDIADLRAEATRRIRICSVEILWRTLRVEVPKISRGGNWVDWQPPWLDDATLAIVGFPEEARFERVLKVERFEIAK